MISPVSQPESSEARNTTTPAMSDGVPMRPSGVMATSCFSNSLPTPNNPAARVPSLSVAENLVLGMEPKKKGLMSMDMAVRMTREISEKYHFEVDPAARVEDIPVGVKQKVKY